MDRRERFESVEDALRGALEGWQSNLWTALPAVVLSFSPALMTVDVQPTVMAKIKRPDGTFYDLALPELQSVPVIFPGGGGYTLTFPIAAGDECLCVIASRCIDMWWYYGLAPNTFAQPQNDPRMHNLSDAFALVGVRNKTRALSPAVVTNGTQLRSDDETMYVQITASEIRLKHPTKVFIDAPATEITGTQQTDLATTLETTLDVKQATTLETTLDVTQGTHLHANLQVDGNGQVNGTLNSTGVLSENGSEVWTKSSLTSAGQIGGITSQTTPTVTAGDGLNGGGTGFNLTLGLNLTLGDKGTFVFAGYVTAGPTGFTNGTQVSGSSLVDPGTNPSTSLSLSGTWKARGGNLFVNYSDSNNNVYFIGVWQRIL